MLKANQPNTHFALSALFHRSYSRAILFNSIITITDYYLDIIIASNLLFFLYLIQLSKIFNPIQLFLSEILLLLLFFLCYNLLRTPNIWLFVLVDHALLSFFDLSLISCKFLLFILLLFLLVPRLSDCLPDFGGDRSYLLEVSDLSILGRLIHLNQFVNMLFDLNQRWKGLKVAWVLSVICNYIKDFVDFILYVLV